MVTKLDPIEQAVQDLDRKLESSQKRHAAEVAAHRTAIGAKNAAERALAKLQEEVARTGETPAPNRGQDALLAQVRGLEEDLAATKAALSQSQASLETLNLERSAVEAARAHEMALNSSKQSQPIRTDKRFNFIRLLRNARC